MKSQVLSCKGAARDTPWLDAGFWGFVAGSALLIGAGIALMTRIATLVGYRFFRGVPTEKSSGDPRPA